MNPKKSEPKPSKRETFYRVVQNSMYSFQLESVTVDTSDVKVEKVGEPDIKTIVMQKLGEKCV